MNPSNNIAAWQEVTCEDLLGPLNQVEQKHAPARLYLAGKRSVIQAGPRVSVVGSRKASPAGLMEASQFAEALVGRGVTVVSGLADGVDTAAHRAAINAGGRTIAVLGTPLDQCTPTANRALQAEIMRSHLAISQFPQGAAVRPGNFPLRNRTMALISDATVICEAGEGSGTVHQGWEAHRLGRPLFLMEGLFKKGVPGWAEELLSYGAMKLSLSQLDALFAYLPEAVRGTTSHSFPA